MDRKRKITMKHLQIAAAAFLWSAASIFPGLAGQWDVRAEQLLGRRQKQEMEAMAQAAAQENQVQLFWTVPLGKGSCTVGPNGGIPEGAVFYSSVDLVWEPLVKTESHINAVHQFGGETGRVYISWDNGRGPLFPYSAAQYEALCQAVDFFCQSCISEEMTDFDKEMQIIRYLIEKVYYPDDRHLANATTTEDHCAYGALVLGEAVCEGYAEAFCWLADACGLETRFIYGNYKGEMHDWNLVKLDGEWYHVDITSEDPYAARGQTNGYGWGKLYNQYLNLTDAQMAAKNHYWTQSEDISCNAEKYGPEQIAAWMEKWNQ